MEFAINTKVGQRVTKVDINIRSISDNILISSSYPEGVHIKDLKIVYQTDRKMALNDIWITLIDRRRRGVKRSSYWHYFEDVNVAVRTNDTIFANGIFGTVYTLGKKEAAIKKLTKAMQAKVEKEYGFLSNINISEMVDKYLLKSN